MAFIANCKKLPVNSLAQSSQTASDRIKPHQTAPCTSRWRAGWRASRCTSGKLSRWVHAWSWASGPRFWQSSEEFLWGPRCLRSKMTWKIRHFSWVLPAFNLQLKREFPIVSYGFPLVAYDLENNLPFFVGISQPATLMSASPCCGCQ